MPSVLNICRSADGSGGTGVFVEGGLGVKVRVGGKYISVFVGLTTVVAVTVVVSGVLVLTGTGVAVLAGNGVRVGNDAPGVRNTSIHAGLVRMAGSRGSMKLTGRLVRKSLLGSRFDPMLVFSFQFGAKRSAHPLARMMQMNPNNRIKTMMMTESRLSFSRGWVFMEMSIDKESHVYCGAWVGLFIMPSALQPDASVMCVYDAARDGQPKPWTAALEFCFSRGM